MRTLITISLAAFLAIGCGETFQGTFQGVSKIDRDTCNNRGGNYDTEIITRLDGNSFDFTITRFRKVGTDTRDDTSKILEGMPIQTSLDDDRLFYVDDGTFENADGAQFNVTADGVLNSSRDEIRSFNVYFSGVKTNGQPCELRIFADRLDRI